MRAELQAMSLSSANAEFINIFHILLHMWAYPKTPRQASRRRHNNVLYDRRIARLSCKADSSQGCQRVVSCCDTESTSPILQRLFDIVNKSATRSQFPRDLPLHSREITCLVSRYGRSTARNGSRARRNRVAHLGKRLNILQTEIFVPS